MTATIVRGEDREFNEPYEAILGGDVAAVLLPPTLQAILPADGDLVRSGPAGMVVPFDRTSPLAVLVWLMGATRVLDVEGPNLLPADFEPVPDVVY